MARKQAGNDREYFDDCGICRAMRKADAAGRGLSLEELRRAFREQNKRKS